MVDCPASKPYVDAPVLADLEGVSHFDEEAARMRLDRVAADLPVRLPARLRFSPGASNDGWDLGEIFLRVCWRADRDRTIREAMLLDALPAGVPHAPVLGYGRTEDLSWMLAGRVRRRPLRDVAPELPIADLHRLSRDLAEVLMALHEWTPSPRIRSSLQERPGLDLAEPLSVFASDLVLLPVPRVLTQLKLARSLPHVDPGLIDAVGERITELSAADPFADRSNVDVVVHGDPSLGNWLVQNGTISALLDFEWARMGPRDLELVTPVFVAQPPADPQPEPPAPPFLFWLAEDYPALFAAPDLEQRLWLYELCFFLRGLIWWPPYVSEAALQPDHHLHTLRRLVDAPLPH